MKKYDVAIIGAGPAGLTATLYAVRNNLKTVLISKDIGGTANSILMLDNWPGYKGSGAELMKKFYEQLKKYNVEILLEGVKSLSKNSKSFILKTDKSEIQTNALIISTGTERKKLNIENEEKFVGKGLSYCTTCDAFFFKNKITAVIGGSDCASTSVLELANISKKVYLVYRGEKLRCEEVTLEQLEKKKNVEIIYNAVPKRILGSEKVEGLEIEVNNKIKKIVLDGIFIEVGSTPLTILAKEIGLKLDNTKHIVVDENMKTSVEGVFAAGDVTNQKLKQVVVATGQGAIASKSAYSYLRK